MDPDNRPSQNTIAYSQDDPQGIAFRYSDLDPAATFRVRVTMVKPGRRRSDPSAEVKQLQSILADGEYIARDVEVPPYTAQQFEHDVHKRRRGMESWN